MVPSVSVVCPPDHVAAWELQLTAAAQHHERVSHRMWLAWERIKIQSTVSTECILLLHHGKIEKSLSRR